MEHMRSSSCISTRHLRVRALSDMLASIGSASVLSACLCLTIQWRLLSGGHTTRDAQWKLHCTTLHCCSAAPVWHFPARQLTRLGGATVDADLPDQRNLCLRLRPDHRGIGARVCLLPDFLRCGEQCPCFQRILLLNRCNLSRSLFCLLCGHLAAFLSRPLGKGLYYVFIGAIGADLDDQTALPAFRQCSIESVQY